MIDIARYLVLRWHMAPWLMNLLQQFGREIVTGTPEVINGVKKEVRAARDPYVDTKMHWLGCGGEADRDATNHRIHDAMTVEHRDRLAGLQASGTWPAFENTKERYRRPWPGAFESMRLPPQVRRGFVGRLAAVCRELTAGSRPKGFAD